MSVSLKITWYGQSAFFLEGKEASVFVDPFGPMPGLAARGLTFDYPAIPSLQADLLLVTHEHGDHNVIGAVEHGHLIRSTTGTFDTPAGKVTGVASEHDEKAGTQRGPNTIFVFEVDGVRVAHFGDFGQKELRPEQKEAIGSVDVALLPVGGGPTIDGKKAAQIAREIGARWAVPMHYGTAFLNFLEPPDAFLEAIGEVVQVGGASHEVGKAPTSTTTGLLFEIRA